MSGDPNYPLTPHMAKLRAIKAKRDQELFELFQSGEHTMREIGVKFGLHPTTVSAAVHKIIRRNKRRATTGKAHE